RRSTLETTSMERSAPSVPKRDLEGVITLPSLGFRMRVALHGVPATMVPWLTARWDFSGAPYGLVDVDLEASFVEEAVGLPSNPLVEADVGWSSPVSGVLLTNSARLELSWRNTMEARGAIHSPHARGAIEAISRALSTLALARRRVTVVHAS